MKKNKKEKKKNNKRTYVAIIVDRSGSMSGMEKQTIEGINSQFKVLKDNMEKTGHTEVSLVQFDDVVQVDFDGVTPDKVKEYGNADYVPRGLTAMYDGIWKGINLLKGKEETEDTGYLICVISDGCENASKEITQFTLKEEIEKLTATDKWTFSYIMANIDTVSIINNLGASINNVASYVSNGTGTATAYQVMNASIGSYSTMRSSGLTSTKAFYSSSDLDDLDIPVQDKNSGK